MRKLITTAIAAAALVAPALTVAGAADAATGASQAAVAQYKAKGKKSLTIKPDKPGSHFGQAGVTIKAVSKKKSGKITFTVVGQNVTAKAKLKKGKASFQVPSTLAPGQYNVTAKVKGGGKAKTKFVVYNSSLSMSANAYTISLSGNCVYDAALTGTVVYKGTNPTEGYVDAYLNGNIEGGNESPDYLTMTSVGSGGTFQFPACNTLWTKVRELGLGTHNVRLLYTPTASYAEYVYSDFVAITVVP